mmetsp:Transcript_24420/g.38036  ORF Transcript_24420/g.38036 Transcript_24420/m.38036 type:complete len:642 (-) Transcript_24420:147-2072(-)|eukprot:CAMPEP_0201515402 /NCGR_PEP_ID=MMETSP0161_2-20130828/6980_1 /ASSEMBLY_ACC=CAM_ASM_000251 /TAXON_ID=180227 /ORGANISM="Neoparamoeba aestuarina, Strain SoJaBio B1-5/56/2" /LENGTH=641 /DNA_ID=CAMNT_0047912215 /DNA_START=15 /DNA_END=1940 /DNA_ORIENTATION=+
MPRRKESTKVGEGSLDLSNGTHGSSSSGSPPSGSPPQTLLWASQARYNEGETWSSGKDLRLRQFSICTGGNDLLVEAELKLNAGEHVGLVGRNGVGKTTLMKAMASGAIPNWPQGLRTFMVEQETELSELLPLQVVLDSDPVKKEIKEEEEFLLQQLEECDNDEDMDLFNSALQELYDQLAEVEQQGPGGGEEKRALEVLAEVGFKKNMLEKPISALSGGWRMRVSLACALFLQPDLLLLDEPTNHLDLRAIIWLQTFLRRYEGTFVVVSHDRMFLNAVCTEIMHFHRCGLKYYPGNYEAFQQARSDITKKKGKLQENLDKKRQSYLKSIQNIEKAAARNKRNEKMSGIAASRRKKYERVGLEKTEDGKKWNCQSHGYRPGSINANAGGWKGRKRTAGVVSEAPDPAIVFHLPAPPPLSIDSRVSLMQLKNVSFSYQRNGPNVIDNIDFSLYPGDRVSFLGPNGSGKSTLMNLLGGVTKPTKGEVIFSPSVKLGYFCQHTTENLEASLSPLQYMEQSYPNAKTSEIRSYLGRYGLASELATRHIGELSGGQKTRAELAKITFCEPHILLLDEPTNHLDLDTIDALIEALSEFKGAIVFVSHNQHMLLSLESVMYEVKKGKVLIFEGSLEDRIQLAAGQTKR